MMTLSRINLNPRLSNFLSEARLRLDMSDIEHIHVLIIQCLTQILNKPHELQPTEIAVNEQVHIAVFRRRPLALGAKEYRLPNLMLCQNRLQALFYLVTRKYCL